ncbi:hypothetical protein GIB67_011072 [Kingdonia uniflora]|uniref:Uncharacterized protein n=1 Tax=Kingdonia uniflora TaxID=39325 RepID=A0A7J7L6L0_9MAGN|nr:hypothetical protein GIB67_011072 [Kingdonia uniflora]
MHIEWKMERVILSDMHPSRVRLFKGDDTRKPQFALKMIIGLLLSCVGVGVAAIVEIFRRGMAIREAFSDRDQSRAVARMSAMWYYHKFLSWASRKRLAVSGGPIISNGGNVNARSSKLDEGHYDYFYLLCLFELPEPCSAYIPCDKARCQLKKQDLQSGEEWKGH